MLPASAMKMVAAPKVVDLDAHPDASRLAERIPGKAITVEFEDEHGKLHVTWQVILRDGSNYVRQQFEVLAKGDDVAIREVRLVDWKLPGAHVIGTVKGSPIVARTRSSPGSRTRWHRARSPRDRARCWIERELPLKSGQTVTYSSVVGVTSARAASSRRAALCGARTRASVSHVPSLQLVVRPGILQQVRREPARCRSSTHSERS